ncbi:MAG: dephospho-CoA kinase [Gammaproteobacteria bacterium]|nr:dephospho-CoA kinase [Gammaproteobacteria bacterium]MCB1818142.1 dephospho-CoA kinase [Gammaproteobacteria bacterium]HOP17216.1 dephospho-CoA kinase [Gammaproteobacteria bacterium]HPQ25250.1 dephospho-CoA kinase [Gammaproteobacteria bacterium]
MLTIGLTGGIGSGKTVASDEFARLGAEVIDTDLLSRSLVEPDQPALTEIVALFGPSVLDATGRLDRAHLREKVFADPQARRELEGILHPKIREAMLERAAQSTAPYVVFVIPLLFETGQQALVDRVLLIDVAQDVQRARVAARDGLDATQITRILQAQTDRATRLAEADDIVHNDAGISDLHAAIAELHRKYLDLARQ